MKNCWSSLCLEHCLEQIKRRDLDEFREEKKIQYINVSDSIECFKVGTYIIGPKMTIF